MPNVLLTGFTGEGDTDRRFLLSIIRRTLEEIVVDSVQQIAVYDPEWLGIGKGLTIADRGQEASLYGSMLFIVHADADASDPGRAQRERLDPAIAAIQATGIVDLPIIPLIPVQETEAWLLADRDRLREALNTELTNQQLDLHGDPERYADPKAKLQEVVRRANEGRGTHMEIELSALYDTLGESCRFDTLGRLPSYQRFRDSLVGGLRRIGYL
ncbi:DUF4276 family protein [Neolewinella sp.]|uniref:DUF4276 family protein n=1 Tax=Neolewinella sp. TaxID=2993543 RepID=UPI003B523AD0